MSEKKYDVLGYLDFNVMGEKWIWSYNFLYGVEERELDDV